MIADAKSTASRSERGAPEWERLEAKWRRVQRLIIKGPIGELEATKQWLVQQGYYVTDEASTLDSFILGGDKTILAGDGLPSNSPVGTECL